MFTEVVAPLLVIGACAVACVPMAMVLRRRPRSRVGADQHPDQVAIPVEG